MNSRDQDTTIPPRPWIEVCESGDWWINTDNRDAFDGGFVCDSNPGIFRNQQTLDYMLTAVNAYDGLVAALHDARLQIEYLHDKFQETGSGNAVLARIEAALSGHASQRVETAGEGGRGCCRQLVT